jgi:hypothetical protein
MLDLYKYTDCMLINEKGCLVNAVNNDQNHLLTIFPDAISLP